MGGRSLFLKRLQKCGSRLWQVREQEEKYVSERETKKNRGEHKSGRTVSLCSFKSTSVGRAGQEIAALLHKI